MAAHDRLTAIVGVALSIVYNAIGHHYTMAIQ